MGLKGLTDYPKVMKSTVRKELGHKANLHMVLLSKSLFYFNKAADLLFYLVYLLNEEILQSEQNLFSLLFHVSRVKDALCAVGFNRQCNFMSI